MVICVTTFGIILTYTVVKQIVGAAATAIPHPREFPRTGVATPPTPAPTPPPSPRATPPATPDVTPPGTPPPSPRSVPNITQQPSIATPDAITHNRIVWNKLTSGVEGGANTGVGGSTITSIAPKTYYINLPSTPSMGGKSVVNIETPVIADVIQPVAPVGNVIVPGFVTNIIIGLSL
jgi:hypothetical protein